VVKIDTKKNVQSEDLKSARCEVKRQNEKAKSFLLLLALYSRLPAGKVFL
jgi:hypothetical protein